MRIYSNFAGCVVGFNVEMGILAGKFQKLLSKVDFESQLGLHNMFERCDMQREEPFKSNREVNRNAFDTNHPVGQAYSA